MAQDLINPLTNEPLYDVPSICMPKLTGGLASFIDAEAWSWLAVEPKHVSTPVEKTFALAATDYANWAASTTAHTLMASESHATFKAYMADHSYALRWRWQVDVRYVSGATVKIIPEWQCGEIWQLLFRRPNSLATLASDEFVGNATVSTRSVPLIVYYNSAGTRTYSYSASYGFYGAATAPTFSSASSDTPTVTIKTPVFSCRCSSTYFATARKTQIDTATKFDYICELYELPVICAEYQMHKGLVDLYNNPLSISTTE